MANRGIGKYALQRPEKVEQFSSEFKRDLLDLNPHISSKKSKKKSSEFPIGPDGRMIIKDLDDGDDDDDEDEEDGEDGGNYNMMDSDSDEENGEKSQNTFEKMVGDKILIFLGLEKLVGFKILIFLLL